MSAVAAMKQQRLEHALRGVPLSEEQQRSLVAASHGLDAEWTDWIAELIEVARSAPDRMPRLWAIQVQNPASTIVQRTYEDAERFKAVLDALDIEHAGRPLHPIRSAVVIEWPGTREEHAEALRREAEED